MNKPGDRVVAIMSAKDGEVYTYGEGVYAGDFIPNANCGGFGEILHKAGVKNPRIDLDSGKTVYGCECWWGSPEKVKKDYGDWKFIEVDIDDHRANQD